MYEGTRTEEGNPLCCHQIVFEGQVGANNLGDIAIDDISIIQGACPSELFIPSLVPSRDRGRVIHCQNVVLLLYFFSN